MVCGVCCLGGGKVRADALSVQNQYRRNPEEFIKDCSTWRLQPELLSMLGNRIRVEMNAETSCD